MSSTIAQVEGTHPLYAGVNSPVDVDAPDSPWTVLAEANPRQATLQANFGEGQVLTMRLSASEAPTKTGNAAVFRPGNNMMARWETHDTHVKLLVEFSGAPESRTLEVALQKSGGIDLAHDEDSGEIGIRAGEERVGALPRPWIEYVPDGAEDDARTRVMLDWVLDGNNLSVEMPALSETEWPTALMDPTVVDTSTVSTATAYSNQRKVDRTSNGVLWAVNAVFLSGFDYGFEFHYSTDDGATWTSGGTVNTGHSNHTQNCSFFIDVDDYAHLVYRASGDGKIYYRRGTPNAARTSWTWSAGVEIAYNTTSFDYPDIVAHPEGSGWAAHVVFTVQNGQSASTPTRYTRIDIASDGTVTANSPTNITDDMGVNSDIPSWPSIDFHHTGDGKTVAESTPHLYVSWSAGATGSGRGIRFKKATYSAGSWTWGTEREIDSTRFISSSTGLNWLNCLSDGQRVVIVGMVEFNSSNRQLMLYDRDAADTTTTTTTLIADANTFGDQAFCGSASYDEAGNLYIVVRDYNGTQTHLDRLTWERSTGTLTRTEVDPATVSRPYPSLKRSYSESRIEWIYTGGTASPYDVTYESILLNAPPVLDNITPTDGEYLHLAGTPTFDADFSDPEGEAAPAGLAFKRQTFDGTIQWWDGAAWVADETTFAGSLPYTFPAGSFTDPVYLWAMAAEDSAGAISAYTNWREVRNASQFLRSGGEWVAVQGST